MSSSIVSIIVPIYNKEPYIRKCVQSLLQQTYQHLEIVIINDGSTDGSDSIMQDLAHTDERIRYYSFTNGGVSKARNRGLERASGEYVIFIDADDYIDANYVERYIEAAEDANADIVIGGITMLHSVDNRQVLTPIMQGKMLRSEFLTHMPEEQCRTRCGLYGFIPNKLIRRSVIEQHSIRFCTTMKKWEDYDFYLSCYAVCNNFCSIPNAGYYYECDALNSSGKLIKKIDYQALINVHVKCLSLLEENGISDNTAIGILNQTIADAYMAAFLEMHPVTMNEIKQYLSRNALAEKCLAQTQSLHRYMRRFVLKRNAMGIYYYVKLWKLYLYIRQNILSNCSKLIL